jgi:hypothetical protein
LSQLLKNEKPRKRREFITTETELKAIAPAANIGCKAGPPKGTSKPAAMGIPITL